MCPAAAGNRDVFICSHSTVTQQVDVVFTCPVFPSGPGKGNTTCPDPCRLMGLLGSSNQWTMLGHF